MIETDIEEQIRVFMKEEIDKHLGEIREQIAGLSSRVDEIERERGKGSRFLKLRKHTLDDLMADYNKVKEEIHKPTEEPTNI